MKRTEKAEEIAYLSERFAKAKAAFLVDFKGMTVEEVTKLRKKLYPAKCEMKVVRNTLAIRALMDHPKSEAALKDKLVGNNAIVFAFEDVGASAKVISDFAKDVEKLQVKTGVMDGNALSEDMVKYLATLPPKPVLQSQLLGLFQQPAAKFLGTLNAAPSGFVRVLNAYKQSKEGQA